MTCTLAPAIPTESVQQKSRFHVYPLRLERTAPRRKAVNILQAALQEAAAAARSTQQVRTPSSRIIEYLGLLMRPHLLVALC